MRGFRHLIPISRIGGFIVLGAMASVSAPAFAVPLVVSSTNGVFLQYFKVSPSLAFGAGSERIRYGAGNVMPNGDPATNGVEVATTGRAIAEFW